MHSKAARYLLAGQLSLFAGLIASYALAPSLIGTDGGFSNYGAHSSTIMTFSLAFFWCAAFTALAASQMGGTGEKHRFLVPLLYMLAVLLLLVLASTYPYKLNPALDWLHKAAAVCLFVFEIFLSGYLSLGVARSRVNILLFTLFLAASAVSLLSLMGVVQILLIGQASAGLAFSALLFGAVRKIEATKA